MAVTGTPNTTRRRLLFGVNVIVQGLLAAAVVVGVIWLAGRFNLRGDWTTTGVNSVSPGTEQLLQNLDENVRITVLFAKPDQERDPIGQKHWREMNDLLDLYDSTGGARVATYMVDPSLQKSETDKLLQRLVELPAYRDEARPHEEALTAFPNLNEQIRVLASGDFDQASQMAQANTLLGQNRNFSIVLNNLRLVLREAEGIAEDIEELKRGEIPRYGQAIREVRDYLGNIELLLRDASTWMSSEALSMAGITPELSTFFEQATERYQPVLDEIKKLSDATQDLEDVKLEEIHQGLTRWRTGATVLVESESEARVLSYWEVWQRPPGPGAPVGPDGDDRQFAGESAISSAILQLTQKDKIAVVFTHYGGQSPIRPDYSQMNQMTRQMPQAPYQGLAELLEKANFLTEDWDVKQDKTPPTVEGAGRTIYVVYPPEPPPRPNPMRPSPEAGMTADERQIIVDAVEQAGMGIFLAGWMPPTSPLPGAKGSYEFAEYLKSNWGVNVQCGYLAWLFAPNPQKPGWWLPAAQRPLITTDKEVRFTKHAIGAPLQADRAGFFLACPISIVESPAGVTAEAVAEVRETEDVWALHDPMRLNEEINRNQGIRRGERGHGRSLPDHGGGHE